MNKKMVMSLVLLSVAAASHGCNDGCGARALAGARRFVAALQLLAIGEEASNIVHQARIQERITDATTTPVCVTYTQQERHQQNFRSGRGFQVVDAEARDTVLKTYHFCTGCNTYADNDTERCGYSIQRLEHENHLNVSAFIRFEGEPAFM